jgi:pyruvate kinase
VVQLIKEKGWNHLGVVAKIETRSAFDNLPEILLALMEAPHAGVMIARGDLALEVGMARLAEVQEEILWMCEAATMPVIWATQVLDNLTREGVPTRAEITDAAMSVHAECVMLNKGAYIKESVAALRQILDKMRHHHNKKASEMRRLEVAGNFFDRIHQPTKL